MIFFTLFLKLKYTKNIGYSYSLNLVLKELKTLNTLGFILGHLSLLSQGIRDFFLFNSLFNC